MRSVDPQDIGSAWDKVSSQEASYVEKALALALLLGLAIGCFLVIKPFLNAILLAVTLCISTWPLFRRIEKKLGGRSAAAIVMTGIAATVLVVPLVFLGTNVADDVARLTAMVRAAIAEGLPPPPWIGRVPLVGTEIERVWIQLTQHGTALGPTLTPYLRPIRDWTLQFGASLVSGTLQVILGVVLAFFLYRDGAYMESSLETALTRLGGWRAQHVLQATGATIKSVVNGVLGTALIQGMLLGLSFWMAQIPGAVLLGAIGVVLTLFPFGLIVLWLPAALWLMSQGHTGWAVFVLVWNGLFVGSLDNVLRPYLISRGVKLPAVLIFLGVLGGVATFGIIGLLLGPVLLAVARTMFLDWGCASEETGPDRPGVVDQPQ